MVIKGDLYLITDSLGNLTVVTGEDAHDAWLKYREHFDKDSFVEEINVKRITGWRIEDGS